VATTHDELATTHDARFATTHNARFATTVARVSTLTLQVGQSSRRGVIRGRRRRA
jgi:hypothetical protein